MFGLKPSPKQIARNAEKKYKAMLKLEEERGNINKKYNEKTKKLKEEIINMGKLTLRDGKIVDESVAQQKQYVPPPVQQQQVRPQPVQNDFVREEDMYVPPQFQQPVQQEDYPQVPVPPQFRPQQVQQQRQQQQPQQQVIGVNIHLSTDRIVDIDVLVSDFEEFMSKLKDSIDTQSYFDIEDGRGFNSRFVAYVEYGTRK